MSNNNFKNIDITFRYETYLSSNKEEKIIKDYDIIKDGKFNHHDIEGDDIRNINFYNFYENKSKYEISTLENTLKDHSGNIKLPFSSNYITLENLNYIVTNESEKKKLTLDDILKEPDKYQDLLDTSFTPNIIQEFVKGLTISVKTKVKDREFDWDCYNKFFSFQKPDDITNITDNNYDIIFKQFKLKLEENTYKDFFIKYKEDQSTFNNYIVYGNSKPIQNLVSELNKDSNLKDEIEKLFAKNSDFTKFRDNNYENFFKITTDGSINHLITYFNKLKENFKENFKKDTEEIRGDYNKIVKLNTPKVFKDILYKYGKYFVNENDYKTNNTPEKFYNFIRSDETLIKKIITYYNIYTILNDIYIIRDSIIYSKEKFSKEINNNRYKKIKKIIPCIQLQHISFNNTNNLKCYFDIKFENINNNSIIRFYTNLINIEKQLINNSKSKKKYINYGTNLFDKNINEKDILISKDIDLNRFKYDFDSLLNKNIEIFKNKKPKNIKEIFFDNDLFNYVLANYKKTNDNYNYDDFFNDLVNKIFFYKNPENILYNNNKFYVIDNVKILKLNELKENKEIIKNFKDNLKKLEEKEKQKETGSKQAEEAEDGSKIKSQVKENDQETLKKKLKEGFNILKEEIDKYIDNEENYELLSNNYQEFDSNDSRLKIDKIDSRFEIYLDVVCYIKNSLDEKVSLNKKMSCNFNCYNSADNLDNLFKILLKQYFDDDSFKRMLNPNTKGNISLIDSNVKEDMKDELNEGIKDKVNEDIKDKVNEDIKKFDTLVNGGKKNKKSNYYFKKIKKNNNKYIKKTLKKNKNKNKNTFKLRKLIKYYLKNY